MNKDIQYIKRSDLDTEKYNNCIKNAKNSRIYAYSWYLDIVADNWDALVLGDYDAVMPIPWRRKYWIYYIYLPAWTQQLGVFFEKNLSQSMLFLFLESIPARFKKIQIFLNDKNLIKKESISIRPNFILDLSNSYDNIYQNYSKNRRQSLRKSGKMKIIFNQNHRVIFPFFRTYIIDKTGTDENDLRILDRLLKECYRKEKAFVVEALNRENNSLGAAVFLDDNKRLYYLFSALSEAGKKQQAMSKIIDKVINKYSDTPYIIDFEGSLIPGIASFFKSFGAIKVPYFEFNKPLHLFKKKQI